MHNAYERITKDTPAFIVELLGHKTKTMIQALSTRLSHFYKKDVKDVKFL